MSEANVVPIDSVIQSESQLRTVDENSEQFLAMVDSMKEPAGLLNAITVRWQNNAETGTKEMILVDGAHRLAACKAAGFTNIKVEVKDINELEAMAAQIIGNIHRVTTKPYQYGKQLQRMVTMNPNLTVEDLAIMSAQSISWVKQRMSLDKLDPAIGSMVDGAEININAAVAIAKLPQAKQQEWAERAITSTDTLEFVESVNTYIKDARKAAAEGRDPNEVTLVITPKLRTVTLLKEAAADPAPVIAALPGGELTAAEIISLTLQWALQIDPATKAAREKENAEKEAKIKAAREAAKADNKGKTIEAMAAKLNKLRAEMEAAKTKETATS